MKRLTSLAFILTLVTACAPQSVRESGDADRVPSYEAAGWTAKTLPEIQSALQDGTVSAEALVSLYLQRIQEIDRSGPELQSVIAVNPDALLLLRPGSW